MSRGPTSPDPSEDLESRPRSETPRGQILEARGAEPASLPWGEDLAFLPLGLFTPVRPSHPSLRHLWGRFFFPNKGSGFIKRVCVQIPQETVLSDSFPRNTWGLHLQFPSWFCYEAPQFSHLVVSLSDSLRSHGLQHARLPSPSLSPGVCPLSQRCHPTISSSVILFSPCLQSFPASGSFQMSSSSHQVAKVLELQHQSFQ